MKAFLVLAAFLTITAVFAAPPNIRVAPDGSLWDFHSSVLDDFEENLRRMRDEFDQLEKSLESRFKFPDTEETGVKILQNGSTIFSLDPSKVKNESFSDTKIVDGKVVHTEEKVIANGNSVVHFKKVEITPKGDKPKKPFVETSDGDDASSSPSSPPPSVAEATSSKNDVDSESVNSEDNYNPARDVEEIESVRSPSQTHTPKKPPMIRI